MPRSKTNRLGGRDLRDVREALQQVLWIDHDDGGPCVGYTVRLRAGQERCNSCRAARSLLLLLSRHKLSETPAKRAR